MLKNVKKKRQHKPDWRFLQDPGPCWSGLTEGRVQHPAAEHLEICATSEAERLQSPVRSETLAAVLLTQLQRV